MAEHGDMRVLHRADDAAGHRLFVEVEGRVDRGDAVVELGEQIVVEVERAVLEDVDFGAGEEAEVGVAGRR